MIFRVPKTQISYYYVSGGGLVASPTIKSGTIMGEHQPHFMRYMDFFGLSGLHVRKSNGNYETNLFTEALTHEDNLQSFLN